MVGDLLRRGPAAPPPRYRNQPSRAAVAHARSHGATAVEGHPVDTDALRAAKVSGSALFTGTMRTFLDVGFSEIARTYPSRPVMRLEL